MEDTHQTLTIVWFLHESNQIFGFEANNDESCIDTKMFKDADKCISFITSSNSNQKFSLFMGDYAKSEIVVTTLDKFPQVTSVFLLWSKSEEENYNSMQHHWINECTKVSTYLKQHLIKPVF